MMQMTIDTMDTFKLCIAVLVLLSGVAGFYYFEEARLLRTLGLAAAVLVALVFVLQTEKGRMAKAFFVSSQVEVRRVVWPSRQETLHTTLMIVVMVVLVALLLWGLDSMFGWLTRKILS